MMKVLYIAVSTFLLTTLAATAQDAPAGPGGAFQLIIHKSGDQLKSINFASGHGTDVKFFSNLQDGDISWHSGDQDDPVRTGTYSPNGNHNVVLGVCAGGNCDVSGAGGFTSMVGDISPSP